MPAGRLVHVGHDTEQRETVHRLCILDRRETAVELVAGERDEDAEEEPGEQPDDGVADDLRRRRARRQPSAGAMIVRSAALFATAARAWASSCWTASSWSFGVVFSASLSVSTCDTSSARWSRARQSTNSWATALASC